MNKHEVWLDKYKGISFEIVRWQGYDRIIWNYYIYLREQQVEKYREAFILPAKFEFNRLSYNYYASAIADIDMHGGITWYSKEAESPSLIIKIGCDYNHFYDEHREYTVDQIEVDAKSTIDDLLAKFPDILVWCQQCGRLNKAGVECKHEVTK